MRVIHPDPNNTARFAKMPPRAARRARIRELRAEAKRRNPHLTKRQLREQFVFRPVVGHAVPYKDHKELIEALKAI